MVLVTGFQVPLRYTGREETMPFTNSSVRYGFSPSIVDPSRTTVYSTITSSRKSSSPDANATSSPEDADTLPATMVPSLTADKIQKPHHRWADSSHTTRRTTRSVHRPTRTMLRSRCRTPTPEEATDQMKTKKRSSMKLRQTGQVWIPRWR